MFQPLAEPETFKYELVERLKLIFKGETRAKLEPCIVISK